MPGTIQVSVLDFKGLHSSSPSSHISVKVLGKREYQTQDKGEFSFPLTTVGENLLITLQDADGNEISHTGVETTLVVEKGVWDDIFSLEGGGHIRMKLQFVLSEEERQIIHILRESELKKKREQLRYSGHGKRSYRKAESSIQNGSVASEGGLVSVPIEKQKSANDRDENEGNISAKSMLQSVNVHRTHPDSVRSEVEKVNNYKKQGPAGKAHSSARKMISAFEGSQNQDMEPSVKPPPKESQTRKTRVDSFMANSHHTEVVTEKIIQVTDDAGTTVQITDDAGATIQVTDDAGATVQVAADAGNTVQVTADAGNTVQVTADACTTAKEIEDRKTSQNLKQGSRIPWILKTI